MLRARVARFYGFSINEINTISFEKLLKFYYAIEVLKAEEMLSYMTVTDYAKHMKDTDRKKLHKELRKTAQKNQDVKIETKSVDDLESMLKGILSGR